MAAIKNKRQLTILANSTMVCSCRSSCIDLPVAIVDFHMEGCASHMHHIYQMGYVDMHEIDIDRSERKICSDCVDELQMGGKPEKLKKVGHSNVYRMDKSEEDKE